ncbi:MULTISPECIES: cytochrome b/b6 domain-containing protein [unclassified Desulfovibrio]|uniref:cytochrome b/b6 domain-containing protein n=1 Tax=unclassified Desulfovibrio TaxID=2593640 RepID=UPI0016397D72|nr:MULTISPECIES: cytochrome b/b6 domain-containing protein [unclassified Desulfovibrio]
MNLLKFLLAQPALLWRFLGFFQPPLLRALHAATVILVIAQFLTFFWGCSDAHMQLGLAACAAGFSLAVCGLWKRGPGNYFPYMFGDFAQLGKDFAAIRGGNIHIAPRPRGLATTVQGLGLGALVMSLATGFWLYLGWESGDVTPEALTAHSVFAWLMLAFLAGHGGMALTHFAAWQKNTAKQRARAKGGA